MTLHRPAPVDPAGATPIDATTDPAAGAARLCSGEILLLTDAYGTGANLLDQVTIRFSTPTADRAARRRQDAEHRGVALSLLAPIRGHALALDGARPIGFLRELYPDRPDFFLPLIEVQELHGAWIRYNEGSELTVLGHALHPFYGTYVPRRTEHLELFATWLSQYSGPRDRAVDVGTGCGVLAHLLARAGFLEVVATDDNPNAIESVRRDLKRFPKPITPVVGDLLTPVTAGVDLVVFNPPWIRGRPIDLLDRALHYEAGLFERFFDQALEAVNPTGRVVLVFSNIGELVHPDVAHPIEAELSKGRFTLVSKLRRRVQPAGTKGKRRTRERVEIWELRTS